MFHVILDPGKGRRNKRPAEKLQPMPARRNGSSEELAVPLRALAANDNRFVMLSQILSNAAARASSDA